MVDLSTMVGDLVSDLNTTDRTRPSFPPSMAVGDLTSDRNTMINELATDPTTMG